MAIDPTVTAADPVVNGFVAWVMSLDKVTLGLSGSLFILLFVVLYGQMRKEFSQGRRW